MKWLEICSPRGSGMNAGWKMAYTFYLSPSVTNPLAERPHGSFLSSAGNKLQTKQNNFLNRGISFWFPYQPNSMKAIVVTSCLPVSKNCLFVFSTLKCSHLLRNIYSRKANSIQDGKRQRPSSSSTGHAETHAALP